MIRLEYIKDFPGVTNVNGRNYKGGTRNTEKYIDASDADVPALVASGMWKVQQRNKPTPPKYIIPEPPVEIPVEIEEDSYIENIVVEEPEEVKEDTSEVFEIEESDDEIPFGRKLRHKR